MKVSDLLDHALPHAREISGAIRARLLRIVAQNRRDPTAAAKAVRAELQRVSPILAAGIRDAQLLGWLTASKVVANEAGIEPVIAPPDNVPIVASPPDEPRVRYPQIEVAARWLDKAAILPVPSHRILVDDARNIAFHVADNAIRETDDSVQAALAKSITTGGTLKEFRDEGG